MRPNLITRLKEEWNNLDPVDPLRGLIADAIDALAEQPAQQQEPVAYASDVEFDDETEIIPAEQKGKLGTAGLRIPLYIDPPASKPWVPLTEFDIDQIPYSCSHADSRLIAFAIEDKLREKNA
jgi:hypothetical protein